MSFLSHLSWRYATKKFTQQKVSQESLEAIKHAICMAPTSFGLQPFHVVHVQDASLRAQLREVAWGQTQITDASDLFVFCARTDFSERVEAYMNDTAMTRNIPRENLQGFADTITGFVNRFGDRASAWAARQAYLAFGFGLAAAAELEIDACPMEGFDPQAFHTILGLPETMEVLSVMALGYRDASDEVAALPKVRFAEDELISQK